MAARKDWIVIRRAVDDGFVLVPQELGGAEPYNEVLEVSVGREGTVTVERYDLPT